MIPHICTIKHDPDNGKYADCFRACVAGILNIERVENVPHWMDANIFPPEVWQFCFTAWCVERGLAPVTIGIDGSEPIEAVHEFMSDSNANALYILIGDTAHGTHCAIYRGADKVHDPAWFPSPIIKAPAGGDWQIIVLAKA